eukprot:1153933-Pelagomonas_calceolata.AAC.7
MGWHPECHLEGAAPSKSASIVHYSGGFLCACLLLSVCTLTQHFYLIYVLLLASLCALMSKCRSKGASHWSVAANGL